jgi:hypothetical protein
MTPTSKYFENLGDTMTKHYVVRVYREAINELQTNGKTYELELFRLKQKIKLAQQKEVNNK